MLIRPVQTTDAPALLAIYAPYVQETAITFETQVPSLQEFENRIMEIKKTYPYFLAEEDGQILGYAYAHAYYGRSAYDKTVELAIYLDQKARGLGLGHQLYDFLEQALLEQGKLNFLACITYPNMASIHFHEKRGFHKVGHFHKVGYKFGQWHDTVWLQKSFLEE